MGGGLCVPATSEELDDFHQFAKERIARGNARMSLTELFDIWRIEHPTQDELEANVLAVKAALGDMEKGDRESRWMSSCAFSVGGTICRMNHELP
jgi:hypothetical protein